MRTNLKHLFTLLILSIFALPIVADERKTIEQSEAWYVLKLGGQRAGYMSIAMKEEGGKLINETAMVLAIKRGDTEMRIEQSSRFVETLDFVPVTSNSSMKLALMATEQHIDFTDEQWVVTATNAGQKTQTKIAPLQIDWLTPGSLAAHFKAAIAKGDKTIAVTTLDPSMGVTPITLQMKRGESKDIEVFGRTVPAIQWTTIMSAAPGIEIEQWTDETGQSVKQMIPLMPGMEIEMLLADKALALAKFDAPEMLAASLITPNKPIKNPRKLKRAVFEISRKDLKKNVGDAVPNASVQTTQWIDADTLRITIDLDKPIVPERFDVRDETLNSSAMLNHKDEVIQELLREAIDMKALEIADRNPSITPGIEARQKVAKQLRDFVRDHIETKDLSVGFASASETARTKQGDCTEHACLLAAMLRGTGIPSRTVTGLVYADQFVGREGIFGFHMWTQAWLADEEGNQRWVDLDAALPGEVDGFDATHIALSTSVMKDGETFNEMMTLLPLMQGMEIRVIETTWAD